MQLFRVATASVPISAFCAIIRRFRAKHRKYVPASGFPVSHSVDWEFTAPLSPRSGMEEAVERGGVEATYIQ